MTFFLILISVSTLTAVIWLTVIASELHHIHNTLRSIDFSLRKVGI